jgi:hypothetical protein
MQSGMGGKYSGAILRERLVTLQSTKFVQKCDEYFRIDHPATH